MIRRRVRTTTIWVALTWMNSSCVERHGSATPADTARAHARAPITTPDSTRNTGSTGSAKLEPGALPTVPAAPVRLWKGPGDQPFEVAIRTADPASALARRFGTVTMRTALRVRTPDLGQFPCTSCHLGRKTILADERLADTHEDITAVHPVQTGGRCSTCHAPDNVEFLALKSGERATLDHTYRLCAQCHFSQADAWAGGAHGKRLDGWQGRRVLMGCADCHDPHRPAIESRIPFRAPQIQRTPGSHQ